MHDKTNSSDFAQRHEHRNDWHGFVTLVHHVYLLPRLEVDINKADSECGEEWEHYCCSRLRLAISRSIYHLAFSKSSMPFFRPARHRYFIALPIVKLMCSVI